MENSNNMSGGNLRELLDTLGTQQARVIEEEEKAIEQQAEEWGQMLAYTPAEMANYMQQELLSTEVLVEGVGYATQMSEGSSLLLAGLIRMRESTEAALAWIESRVKNDDESQTEATIAAPSSKAVTPNTVSPKTTNPKAVNSKTTKKSPVPMKSETPDEDEL